MCDINGDLLKSKMVLLGYTQKTLAEEIDVASVTLNYIFNNKNLPSLSVMRKLQKALQLTPEDISEIFFSGK